MIDFRYHIVSIVAVFLALGIGLLMGSGVVGEPLLDNIRDRARDVQDFNDRLKDDVVGLEQELSISRSFVEAVEPMLVEGRLAGEQVVIVDVAAGDVPLDSMMEMLEDRAGATVASIVTISEDFALAAEEDAADMARIIGSTATPEELRVEAAVQLGEMIAALSEGGRNTQGRDDLIQAMEDEGFLDVAEEEEARPVPPGASVVITASGVTDPTFRIDQVVTALGRAAAEGGVSRVAVVETSDSVWGIAGSVRGDGDLSNIIATVDNVDKLSGRIALAMALDLLEDEEPGHYGEKGDVPVIPEPGTRD